MELRDPTEGVILPLEIPPEVSARLRFFEAYRAWVASVDAPFKTRKDLWEKYILARDAYIPLKSPVWH